MKHYQEDKIQGQQEPDVRADWFYLVCLGHDVSLGRQFD